MTFQFLPPQSTTFFELVVTHQWSGDLSIAVSLTETSPSLVVTHQWSGDLSIYCIKYIFVICCRNSPMIWWPFNPQHHVYSPIGVVVTHQWSGDLSINFPQNWEILGSRNSPMIWWPFNLRELGIAGAAGGRNSPMIWWPFNRLHVWTNGGSTKS